MNNTKEFIDALIEEKEKYRLALEAIDRNLPKYPKLPATVRIKGIVDKALKEII